MRLLNIIRRMVLHHQGRLSVAQIIRAVLRNFVSAGFDQIRNVLKCFLITDKRTLPEFASSIWIAFALTSSLVILLILNVCL